MAAFSRLRSACTARRFRRAEVTRHPPTRLQRSLLLLEEVERRYPKEHKSGVGAFRQETAPYPNSRVLLCSSTETPKHKG